MLVDRRGADLLAVCRNRRPPVGAPAGDASYPVKKALGTGRATWRYEHRVEENWARNARLVAAALERLVDAVDAQVVIVAGDDHARTFLCGCIA